MNTTTNTTTVLLLLKEKMLQPQIQPPRYKTPHKQLDTRQGQSPTVSDCHRGEKYIYMYLQRRASEDAVNVPGES